MERRASLTASSASAVAAMTPFGRQAAVLTPALARTRAIVAAADALLASLDARQRAALAYPFPREPVASAAHFLGGGRRDIDMVGERYGDAVWSNFPVSDVPRPGLRMGALSEGQCGGVHRLLQACLSRAGTRKVGDIMGSDQALADGGTPYESGRDAYTLALFGEPGDRDPWMVQFGGHHLALNLVLAGERAVLAPVLTGCLPAIYAEQGRTVRALAAENDTAFALLSSFDDAQRRQVLIDHPVSTLLLGPGHDGETVPPQGLPGSAMDARQRALLFDLASEWVGLLNDAHAAPRLDEIRAGLADTRFAWAGPLSHEPGRNGASYFRVDGPTLFIEFAPQRPGGDLTMHVHTVYRDRQHAYGRGLA